MLNFYVKKKRSNLNCNKKYKNLNKSKKTKLYNKSNNPLKLKALRTRNTILISYILTKINKTNKFNNSIGS